MIAPKRRILLLGLLWIVAFAGAFGLDRPVAERVRSAGWDDKPAWSKSHRRVNVALKFPGEYWFTLVVATAVGLSQGGRWQGAALVALSGAISGVNGVVKWIAGRHRPVKGVYPFDFEPFTGGLRGLFKAQNLCFPSGHACLAFAVAGALATILPRWRWSFYALASIVGIERIVENAHYPSDVVAAAALGLFSAWLAKRILRKWSDPPKISAGIEVALR